MLHSASDNFKLLSLEKEIMIVVVNPCLLMVCHYFILKSGNRLETCTIQFNFVLNPLLLHFSALNATHCGSITTNISLLFIKSVSQLLTINEPKNRAGDNYICVNNAFCGRISLISAHSHRDVC